MNQNEKIYELYNSLGNKGIIGSDRADIIRSKLGIDKTNENIRKIVSKIKIKLSKTQNLPDLPSEIQEDLSGIIDQDLNEINERKEGINTQKKYKELLIRLGEKEDQVDTILNVKGHKPKFKNIAAIDEKSEATAVLLASDWHSDEIVDPATINYLNEYNPSIAEKRAINFFRNGLKLTDIMSHDIKIEHIVLAILGDMISGYIHPELIENNAMSPTQALIKFRTMLLQGIDYILKESNYNLTIICKIGNHGRTTEKTRVSTDYKNSYEWLIYHLIADDYKDNPRVNFIVENGYHTYFKIYNTTLRFHHGNAINYGGGVGGITIPVNKAIGQWNKMKQADIDVFGHFHTMMFHKNFVSNGSLVGFNSYAERIKADFEQPQQAFFLIDKDRGKTIQAPIFVTDIEK